MKLQELKNPEKFVSLYAVDFGDHSAIGYTADEIAMLLESQKYKHIKVYKIHNARIDGTLELKGMTNETFNLEMAMAFNNYDENTAAKNFQALVNSAVTTAPPCRANIKLVKFSDNEFATTIVYPAEYNDDISSWLKEIDYKTQGSVDAGVSVVEKIYDADTETIETHQLWPNQTIESRTADELVADINKPIQRFG